MAAVKLVLKNYREAITYCDLVIREDPKNLKSHYRKAQCLIELDNFEDAEVVFAKLFEIDDKDREVNNLHKQLQQKVIFPF